MFKKRIFVLLIPLLLLPSTSFAGKDVMRVTDVKAYSDTHPEQLKQKLVEVKKALLGKTITLYSEGKFMTLVTEMEPDKTCKELHSNFSEADFDCSTSKGVMVRLYVKKFLGLMQSAILRLTDIDNGNGNGKVARVVEIVFEKE